MKFIVVGTPKYHYTLSAAESFKALGYEAEVVYYRSFYENCSYLTRKLYKMGCGFLESSWHRAQENFLLSEIIRLTEGTHDKICLVVEGNIVFSDEFFTKINNNIYIYI